MHPSSRNVRFQNISGSEPSRHYLVGSYQTRLLTLADGVRSDR